MSVDPPEQPIAYPGLPAPGQTSWQPPPTQPAPHNPYLDPIGPSASPPPAHYPPPYPYGAPYGYLTGYPPPAPPPPSRTWPWVALGAAVLLGVSVAVWIGVRTTSATDEKVALPTSFAGYTRLDNDEARSVEGSIRGAAAGVAGLQDAFDHAAIGVYSKNTGDSPAALTVLFSASYLSSSSNSGASDMQDAVRQFVPTAQSMPPGPHGGSLVCGQADFGPTTETVCGWEDAKTGGLFFAVRPALSVTGAAAVTNSLRDAVD